MVTVTVIVMVMVAAMVLVVVMVRIAIIKRAVGCHRHCRMKIRSCKACHIQLICEQ